jgi:putative MFS transporter
MRIEEFLDLEKPTQAQNRILWIARISWSFVAMEIIIISFTLPLFIEIFALDSLKAGILLSGVLIGDTIGAVIFGRLSDMIGRRKLFQISLIWYSIFTALTALSFNYESLLAFRILAGMGLGGMLVVDPALLSEFLPRRKRGNLMVSLDLFWPFGSLLALLLAYIFLVGLANNWRGLFLTIAFPAFTIGLFRLYVPESPFYLAKTGRLQEAANVISRIINKEVNSKEIVLAIEEEGSYKELFSKYALRVIVMLIAWCVLNYTYYGLFLWLPEVLKVAELYGNIWLYLIIAFIFQIPGYLSAMYLVEKIGRKTTLVTYLFFTGITGISMGIFYKDPLLFSLSLLAVSFFNLGAWGSVYPYTSELFPTKLRGKAFGLAEGIGKIIATIAPIIFGALIGITKEVTIPLIVITGISAIAAIAIFILGPETKNLIFD